MRTLMKVLLVSLLALAPACGDDDDDGGGLGGGGGGGDVSEEERPFVDAAAESFQEDIDASDEEAECVGTVLVDGVGMDRIEDSGVTPEEFGDAETPSDFGIEDFTEDDADDVISGIEDCGIDLKELMLGEIGADVPEDAIECVDENLDDQFVHDLFVALFVGGEDALTENPEFTETLGELQTACPEAFGG